MRISRLKLYFLQGIARGAGFALFIALCLAGVLAAQSLTSFRAGEVVSASQINANFTFLSTRLAPVGSITAWHKDLSVVAVSLPAGWVECNGQTVGDTESSLYGVTLPDLNNARNAWNSGGSFLRGGTSSGTFEDDEFQGHTHSDPGHTHSYTDTTVEDLGYDSGYAVQSGPGNNGRAPVSRTTAAVATGIAGPSTQSNGLVRFGDETKPVNMSVIWIIRIK